MTETVNNTQDSEAIDINSLVVGVLGGTGEQGRGLATRLSQAGVAVIIGSRTQERASEVAREINASVRGMSNADVATECDVVIVAVPWDGHKELLEGLAG